MNQTGELAPPRGCSVAGNMKVASSSTYWEDRYRSGGTSGPGSYDRLAQFKAAVLNGFVAEHGIGSVLEFGAGDGSQLELATYPSYVGVDVSPTALALCHEKFRDRPDREFHRAGELSPDATADLTLSLDVVFHLVEDDVFDRYMAELFDRSRRFAAVYSSNRDDDQESAGHVRHRAFTDWVARHRPAWRLVRTVPNAFPFDAADPDHTSFADFYFYERSGSPAAGNASTSTSGL